MSRRDVITAGSLSALGLSMGDWFRLQAAENNAAFTMASGSKKEAKALSVIQLHLGGGMQQQESFDPKTEAPVKFVGSLASPGPIPAIT